MRCGMMQYDLGICLGYISHILMPSMQLKPWHTCCSAAIKTVYTQFPQHNANHNDLFKLQPEINLKLPGIFFLVAHRFLFVLHIASRIILPY